MKCPHCKDGFYYPLIGPPENCQTCNILGQKTQAEDRKTLSELADTEQGYAQPQFIHGFTASEAELRRFLQSKREHADASLQRCNAETGLLSSDPNEFEINKNGAPSLEVKPIDDLAEHNARLKEQGNFISMMESARCASTKPMEYAKYLEQLIKITDSTVAEFAEKISKPTQFVQDYLNLLKLDPDIQQLINEHFSRKQRNVDPETDWSEYIPKSLTESKMCHMGLVFKEYPTTLLNHCISDQATRVIMKSFLEHTPITEIATILMKAEGTISIFTIITLANEAIDKREARCETNRAEP